MPEQLRVKHSQDLEKEKKDFREKIALFRAQHPDLVPNPEKSGVPLLLSVGVQGTSREEATLGPDHAGGPISENQPLNL